MPSCDYCEASFDEETAYLEHLASEHESELGPIDQRRVTDLDTEESRPPLQTLSLVLIAIGVIGVLAYVFVLSGNGGAAGEPTYDPQVHEHGTMVIEIEGESLDVSTSDRFVENDQIFHFHGYEYPQYGAHIWHIHGHDVTIQYALETLGFELSDDGEQVTFDGETYDASDPDTTIELTVNGEPASPDDELTGVGPEDAAAAGEGDDLVLVIERD